MASSEDQTPPTISLSMRAELSGITASATLSIREGDCFEVEESETRKYLALKNGTLSGYSSVYFVVEGQRMELTTDFDPEIHEQSS